MTTIDPTTNLGRARLACADYGDIPYLPDSVYLQTLVDNGGSLSSCVRTCAAYILGMLSQKVDRKLGLQLSVNGSQAFRAYKEYLIMITKDPAFFTLSPVPYNTFGTTVHPLITFQKNWGLNISQITVDNNLVWGALGSPNNYDAGNWNWPG